MGTLESQPAKMTSQNSSYLKESDSLNSKDIQQEDSSSYSSHQIEAHSDSDSDYQVEEEEDEEISPLRKFPLKERKIK